MRLHAVRLAPVVIMLISCGGGSSGGGAIDNSGSPGGNGAQNPPPASDHSGLWKGEPCCVRFDPFDFAAVSTSSGQMSIRALGYEYVIDGLGSRRYARCHACLGGPIVSEPDPFELKVISALHDANLTGEVTTPGSDENFPSSWRFTVPYVASFDIPATVSMIDGSYGTSNGEGYTLTLVIERDGSLSGSDTNSCALRGTLQPGQYTAYFDASIEVTGCGPLNGKYRGVITWFGSTAADGVWLTLANNANGIDWVLM